MTYTEWHTTIRHREHGDEAGIEVPDETYEAWDTLADVLETAGKLVTV